MRTVLTITATLLVICLIIVSPAHAANGVGYAGYINNGAYCAGPCQGGAYCGPLVPGCCEYPPSCKCDDIWAGYCQEKQDGCCWPALCIPFFGCHGGCASHRCVPHMSPARCGQAICAEEVVSQPANPPAGKTANPAPKPVEKKPAAKPAPPAKPKPKEASTKKSSSAWRFLPAAHSSYR